MMTENEKSSRTHGKAKRIQPPAKTMKPFSKANQAVKPGSIRKDGAEDDDDVMDPTVPQSVVI